MWQLLGGKQGGLGIRARLKGWEVQEDSIELLKLGQLDQDGEWG